VESNKALIQGRTSLARGKRLKTLGWQEKSSSRFGVNTKTSERLFGMSFARVYPLYVGKAERKGRTQAEVDEVICWLTGYSRAELGAQIKKETDFKTFIKQAPQLNPARDKITGVVCGVRVEDIEDATMREIRYLDKLVDELAKGKPMEKVLRA
jgi:hypothetical protein